MRVLGLGPGRIGYLEMLIVFCGERETGEPVGKSSEQDENHSKRNPLMT